LTLSGIISFALGSPRVKALPELKLALDNPAGFGRTCELKVKVIDKRK
jgi:hypothetical protein